MTSPHQPSINPPFKGAPKPKTQPRPGYQVPRAENAHRRSPARSQRLGFQSPGLRPEVPKQRESAFNYQHHLFGRSPIQFLYIIWGFIVGTYKKFVVEVNGTHQPQAWDLCIPKSSTYFMLVYFWPSRSRVCRITILYWWWV